MYAGRFVSGPCHVLFISARIDVRLRLGAAFAAELEYAIAQALQEG